MKNTFFLFALSIGLLPIFSTAQAPEIIRATDLFGDLTARHIGPALMSGRINDMEVHPTNSRIIYAGTAGGGVWKSNDAGQFHHHAADNQYLDWVGLECFFPTYCSKILIINSRD